MAITNHDPAARQTARLAQEAPAAAAPQSDDLFA